MNDKQLAAMWKTSRDEMSVWRDRLHEAPTSHLVDLIMFLMPLTMTQQVLAEISKDITDSRNEENDNGYPH